MLFPFSKPDFGYLLAGSKKIVCNLWTYMTFCCCFDPDLAVPDTLDPSLSRADFLRWYFFISKTYQVMRSIASSLNPSLMGRVLNLGDSAVLPLGLSFVVVLYSCGCR